MRTIYLTYCSWQKDEHYKNTCERTTPDRLYRSERISAFVKTCKAKTVEWAIFSDLYGIWFPEEMHEWYDKSPDAVKDEEVSHLVKAFDKKLIRFDKIAFFVNKDTFHGLYKEVIDRSKLSTRIIVFDDLSRVGCIE